jgi:hypothetical protein
LTFFRHFRHVAKFRHVENGQFWCYFDVSGHFKTFWFFDLFSSLSTRVEILTCRKWSFLSSFYEKKFFFNPKTPLFCQKQHLTSDAAGHDLLTSSSNLALVTSQRSCIPSLVILGQEGHELSCPQTDDRQTDRQTKRSHKAAFRYLIIYITSSCIRKFKTYYLH